MQLYDISIYPQSSCAPASSDQHLHLSASTMIPPSDSVTSGQSDSLHAIGSHHRKWSHSSQHGTNRPPLVTLLPHNFLHKPPKEVPPASSQKITLNPLRVLDHFRLKYVQVSFYRTPCLGYWRWGEKEDISAKNIRKFQIHLRNFLRKTWKFLSLKC